MEYIKREAERKFREMSNFFKVVLVTGARQVGKTTMLKKLADGTDRTYVSLDDIIGKGTCAKRSGVVLSEIQATCDN